MKKRNYKNVLEQLQGRTKHPSLSVQKIAEALLFNANAGGWVKELIMSDELDNYHSVFETALFLEKLVLFSEVGDWWQKASDENQWEKIKVKLIMNNIKGWGGVVDGINFRKYSHIIGLPVQTHRIGRYKEVINNVLIPRFGKGSSDLVILDAGAAAGWGALEAVKSGFRFKKWIAVDQLLPWENMAWFLTCTVRVEEIISGHYKSFLRKRMGSATEIEFLKSKLENIEQIPDSSVDVYLAIYSFYQVKKLCEVLDEAKRVLKIGGIIVATDNFIKSCRSIMAVSPFSKGRLLTEMWVNKKRGLSNPIPVYEWYDSEFRKGKQL